MRTHCAERFNNMSILFANGVSIEPVPGGGISAKVKDKPELAGIKRVLGTPVLVTLHSTSMRSMTARPTTALLPTSRLST